MTIHGKRAMGRVEALLSLIGFVQVPNAKKIPMMCVELDRQLNSEFVRFFSPQITTYSDGRGLVGVVGSMVNPFVENRGVMERIGDLFVVSVFTSNFPRLLDSYVLFSSEEGDIAKVEAILDTVLLFPTNRDELRKFRDNEYIAGFRTDGMHFFGRMG